MKLLNFKKKELDIFKDPFQKKSVKKVCIFIYPDETRLSVHFVNGMTKGEQNINKRDFTEALRQAQVFIDSLPE